MLFNLFDDLTQTARTPLTIYQILRSAAYDSSKSILEEPTNNELIENYKDKIFDFSYPVTVKVSDSETVTAIDSDVFEQSILRHYFKRRIGFDTVKEFKYALRTKLDDMMPRMCSKFWLYYQMSDDFLNYTSGSIQDSITTETDGTVTNSETNSNTHNSTKNDLYYNNISKSGTDVDISETVTNYTTGEKTNYNYSKTHGGVSNTVNGFPDEKYRYSDTPQTFTSGGFDGSRMSDLQVVSGMDYSGNNNSTDAETTTNGSQTSTLSNTTEATENIVNDDKETVTFKDYTSRTLTDSNEASSTLTVDDTKTNNLNTTIKTYDPEHIRKFFSSWNKNFSWYSEIFKELDELFLSVE